MSPIYTIAGDKGDGKSLFSMGVLDYLTKNGDNCLLIDSDILNPDVYTIYSKEVPSVILDLSTRDGWIELINLCESNHDKTVVINGTADGIIGMEKHSKILLNCLFALKRHLVTFWMMSDDTSNFDTLDRYKKVVGRRVVHIVNNEKYEGNDTNDFLLTKRSDRYQEFRRNGRVLHLPNLPEDTYEWSIDEKITIKNFCNFVCDPSKNDDFSYQQKRSRFHEMSWWRDWIDDGIFRSINWQIGEIIDSGDGTYYRIFTRKLADEIERALNGSQIETFDYSPGYDRSNDWSGEDIGDLLAAGKVNIEDLDDIVHEKEEHPQFVSPLEPETEEEYQERLQREYRSGGNPVDFIATAEDIRYRACEEYIVGGNPQNFVPSEREIRARDLHYYRQGHPPVGFVPTQNEIDGVDYIDF
jgi:hypothetical protein